MHLYQLLVLAVIFVELELAMHRTEVRVFGERITGGPASERPQS